MSGASWNRALHFFSGSELHGDILLFLTKLPGYRFDQKKEECPFEDGEAKKKDVYRHTELASSHAESRQHFVLDQLDERHRVVGCAAADVHEEVRVLGRDLDAADAPALQPGSFDETSREITLPVSGRPNRTTGSSVG